jgi:hypothetical protein
VPYVLAAFVAFLSAMVAMPAQASPATDRAAQSKAAAPTLWVSQSQGLAPAGQSVTVSGSGFDETKGIYVGICRDNGPGALPTPCDGGAGAGGAVWVSSNPPDYGVGLAIPYGPGGTFSVQVRVAAQTTFGDCSVLACIVATRADHTRGDDRSQDVRVPVTFAAPPPRPPTASNPTGGARPDATAANSATTPAQSPSAQPSASTPAPTTRSTGHAPSTTLAALPVAVPSSPGNAGLWWAAAAVVVLAAGLMGALWMRARRTGTAAALEPGAGS